MSMYRAHKGTRLATQQDVGALFRLSTNRLLKLKISEGGGAQQEENRRESSERTRETVCTPTLTVFVHLKSSFDHSRFAPAEGRSREFWLRFPWGNIYRNFEPSSATRETWESNLALGVSDSRKCRLEYEVQTPDARCTRWERARRCHESRNYDRTHFCKRRAKIWLIELLLSSRDCG